MVWIELPRMTVMCVVDMCLYHVLEDCFDIAVLWRRPMLRADKCRNRSRRKDMRSAYLYINNAFRSTCCYAELNMIRLFAQGWV